MPTGSSCSTRAAEGWHRRSGGTGGHAVRPYSTNLGLMLSGGNIPDLIWFQGGDEEFALTQKILVDMTDYVENSVYMKDAMEGVPAPASGELPPTWSTSPPPLSRFPSCAAMCWTL